MERTIISYPQAESGNSIIHRTAEVLADSLRKSNRNIPVTKSTLLCHAVVILTVCAAAFSAHAEDPWEAGPEFEIRSTKGVVAADNPVASEVGARVLAEGGNAVDASVATLLALGVVNPFASGLGGGGFCLVRPPDGDVAALDFRERAPAAAHRDLYVFDGEVDASRSWRGGLAVGIPTEALGLYALHERYGVLPWGELVTPAYELASQGFAAGELLPIRLEARGGALDPKSPHGRIYRRGDRWVQAGEKVERPDLARALALLRDEGPDPFFHGPIAEAIVAAVQADDGILTLEDMKSARVHWRKPVQTNYRGHTLYMMPSPSSGGYVISIALQILEGFDLRTLGHSDETHWRVIEAMRHAFADRARWMGDADFVDVPTARLLSPDYARKKRQTILPHRSLELEEYGTAAPPPDDGGTSHLSVIDNDRMMVACTSTINTSFASRIFVEEYGLILNNEMGDFTAAPGVANNFGLVGSEQNAVQAGKAPLSSMSPTIVLRDGEPFLVVGASGGPTIISATLLTIVRLIDLGFSPHQAVVAPRFHHQWLPESLFIEKISDQTRARLSQRGLTIDVRPAFSSTQIVMVDDEGQLVGVSDPRKRGRPASVESVQKRKE